MTCGIYRILHRDSGKMYIGSSYDIEWRFWDHRRHLDQGSHVTPILQKAWRKYGKDAFDWDVLEECGRDDLLEREQVYLDRYFSAGMLYNTNPKSGRPPGMRAGSKHPPEVIAKMSASWTEERRRVSGEKSKAAWTPERRLATAERARQVHTGKVTSDETKAKIATTKARQRISRMGE